MIASRSNRNALLLWPIFSGLSAILALRLIELPSVFPSMVLRTQGKSWWRRKTHRWTPVVTQQDQWLWNPRYGVGVPKRAGSSVVLSDHVWKQPLILSRLAGVKADYWLLLFWNVQFSSWVLRYLIISGPLSCPTVVALRSSRSPNSPPSLNVFAYWKPPWRWLGDGRIGVLFVTV